MKHLNNGLWTAAMIPAGFDADCDCCLEFELIIRVLERKKMIV